MPSSRWKLFSGSPKPQWWFSNLPGSRKHLWSLLNGWIVGILPWSIESESSGTGLGDYLSPLQGAMRSCNLLGRNFCQKHLASLVLTNVSQQVTKGFFFFFFFWWKVRGYSGIHIGFIRGSSRGKGFASWGWVCSQFCMIFCAYLFLSLVPM